MKIRHLLLFGGVAATISSQAAVVQRTLPALPAPATQALAVDGETAQYLYNLGTNNFLCGDNNYYTRASVNDTLGYQWKVVPQEDPNYVALVDSVERNNDGKYVDNWGWRKMFIDSADAMWVDNNNGANANTWQISPLQNNAFVIKNSAFDGVFGVLAGEDTRTYVKDAATENFGAQWAAVSIEEYNRVIELRKPMVRVYAAANTLMKKINDTEEQCPGIDLSAAIAVYNNEGASLEDLTGALALVDDAVMAYLNNQASFATPENPLDMTSKIVNPSFESKTEGWSAAEGTTIYATQTNNEFVGKDGTTYAEFYHKNGKYSIQQVIPGMPAGIYSLTARVHSSNKTGQLYINDQYSEFYGENDVRTFRAAVQQPGDLIIGACANDDGSAWNGVDNFSLLYLGNNGDAWVAILPQFSAREVSPSVLNEYTKLLDAIRNASTDADRQAAVDAAKTGIAPVQANADAWAAYKEQVTSAEALVADPKYSSVAGFLADYLKKDVADPTFEDCDMTVAQIEEEIEFLKGLYDDVLKQTPAGTDMTKLLTNVDFADEWNGWTKKAVSGGNVAANKNAHCAEAWNNKDFDIYQEVENAPEGVYQIEVQGFYRYGRGDDAWKAYFDETTGEKLANAPQSTAFVYLNANQTPLSNVFDEPVTNGELYTTTGDLAPYVDPLQEKWYPNDMSAAGQAFDEGKYVVKAMGLVKAGDKLRIGVKGNTTQKGDSWAIFTRFKLTYQAYDAKIIKEELDKAYAALGDGKYGKEIKEKIAAIKTQYEAVNKEDGKAMFAVLSDIYDLSEAMNASTLVFADLKTKVDEVEAAYTEYESTADPAAAAAAAEAYNAANDGYSTGSITTDEAKDLISQINLAIAKLKIPAGDPTDDAPVDYSPVLVNASQAEGTTGWVTANASGAGVNNGCVEFFQKTYDYYQDMLALPAGMYKVSVQGFYRQGATPDDWGFVKSHQNALASLYAQSGSNEPVSVALRHISAEAVADAFGCDGETSITPFKDGGDETAWYQPNTMASASNYFENGLYNNALYVKVNEGETLRIGIKQTETVANGWCIFTNFKVEGYGAASAKEQGAITSSYANPTPVPGEGYVGIKGIAEKMADAVGKFVKNGQVVIKKAGKLFNLSGQEVK